MNDNRHLIRNIQKKTVSHYLAHSTSYLHIMKHRKVLGMFPFDKKTAWIVIEISFPTVKLLARHQNLVIIPILKKPLSGRHCHMVESPIGSVTASFETSYHMPEVLIFRHILTHSYYQVNMVRHDTHLPHIYHGVKLMNLPYFLIEDDHTKF